MSITQSEIFWLFFQAIILGISIIGLDWDARGEGFGLKVRLIMVLVLVVATVFLGSPGAIGGLLLYWFYTRHFKEK